MVNENKNKIKSIKGQSLSADVLVVIIILLFGALFLLANNLDEDNISNKNVDKVYDKSSKESKLIFEELKSRDYLDAENNVKVKDLQTLNVNDLKENLNIQSKFCIVFEKDGKLIKIDPENNVNGIGDSEIVVNGVPCTFN